MLARLDAKVKYEVEQVLDQRHALGPDVGPDCVVSWAE